MLERFNRTLGTMLATLLEPSQRNWDEILPYVLYAYRTSIHAATGDTPFYLMYGRDAINPTDIALREGLNPAYADDFDFKLAMQNRFQKAWTSALRYIELKKEVVRARQSDPPDVFEVGDLVRLHTLKRKVLQPSFISLGQDRSECLKFRTVTCLSKK